MADTKTSTVRDNSTFYSTSAVPLTLALPDLIGLLKRGLPFTSFEKLRRALGVTARELSDVLQIASRTLARRREEGKMRTDESERLYRLARLYDLASTITDTPEQARIWFTTPKRALGGATPLVFADTEPGAREVEHLIGRLEHGVFS